MCVWRLRFGFCFSQEIYTTMLFAIRTSWINMDRAFHVHHPDLIFVRGNSHSESASTIHPIQEKSCLFFVDSNSTYRKDVSRVYQQTRLRWKKVASCNAMSRDWNSAKCERKKKDCIRALRERGEGPGKTRIQEGSKNQQTRRRCCFRAS